MKNKIINLFCWNLNDIITNLDKIKDVGFTHIQISPIQECKEGDDWWKLYQPYSFNIGNRLGTKYDFINLCDKAHNIGLKIVVDVVLRHLAGDEKNYLTPHKKCDITITSVKDFWCDAIDCNNYNDRWQEINRCTGLPLLNYNNPILQNDYYIPFLDEVLKYADGLRIDQVKHYALPTEGGTFLQNVLSRYKNKFIYGECINLSEDKLRLYSNYCIPLIANYETFSGNSVRFFESADTYKSFLYTLSMTDKQRINNWKMMIQCFDNVIFFAREWDKLIFSKEMKEINNKNI